MLFLINISVRKKFIIRIKKKTLKGMQLQHNFIHARYGTISRAGQMGGAMELWRSVAYIMS